MLRKDLLPGDAFEYVNTDQTCPGPIVVDYSDRRSSKGWAVSASTVTRPFGAWPNEPVRLIPRWDGYIRTLVIGGIINGILRVSKPVESHYPHTCHFCGAPAYLGSSVDCSKSCPGSR